jgi:hypothetical protein
VRRRGSGDCDRAGAAPLAASSKIGSRAAAWTRERAVSRPSCSGFCVLVGWLRVSEEGSGFKARSARSERSNQILRDPRPRCSCRRSAGGADGTSRDKSRFCDIAVSSDPTKAAAPRRTSQRAERAIRRSELGERAIKHRIARRRAEEERGDMHFVAERRRSRRALKRDPRPRCSCRRSAGGVDETSPD